MRLLGESVSFVEAENMTSTDLVLHPSASSATNLDIRHQNAWDSGPRDASSVATQVTSLLAV